MHHLEEQLIGLLKQSSYIPLSLDELAKALQVSKQQLKRLRAVVYALLDQGVIAKVKKDKFVLPSDADLVTGTVKFKQSGSAMLFPENAGPHAQPFQVRAEDTHVALHKDLVVARLLNIKQKPLYYKGRKVPPMSDAPYVRIIRILKRHYTTITGTLKKGPVCYYVIPDDPHIGQDFIVPDPAKSDLKVQPKENDKVVVELMDWEQRHLNPTGTIIEVLGKAHTPQAEFAAILHKYNLNFEFPDAVEKEVQAIPSKVRPQDTEGRLDCTRILTLTIDPDDAKDFDDALSIEHLANGAVEIGVHIADVSGYVAPNTALDKEAHRRGNSTYLVGTVVPMLPHALSSGLCSLVENEIRLTKSVFFTFINGRLSETRFANSFIRSQKRFTYKQAYALLKEDDLDVIRNLPMPPAHQTGFAGRPLKTLGDAELKQLQATVRTFWDIAHKLREARMHKGSLDLDMPEVKIFVDQQGYADRIEQIVNDESHQLIEEFMLLANETVAKALHETSMPYISRVHDKPDASKLDELSEVLANHGLLIGDLTHRGNVNKFLAILKDHPQGYSLKLQFLRSLRQACYRAQADGHYGLNKVHYAHFTSPIRRYADLVVHRVFDHYLTKVGNPTAPKKIKVSYSQAQQEAMAQHISLCEQQSVEAERESVKLKLLEYFERENERPEKRIFTAIITDVRNHGLFVELCESLAFGFIHISTLEDDLYSLMPSGKGLEGRRTKNRYRVGEKIGVIVERVDRFKRQIDFRVYVQPSSIVKRTQPPMPLGQAKRSNNKQSFRRFIRKKRPKN